MHCRPIAERVPLNPAKPLQTYLPFEFFPDREPEMFASMRHIRREAGIRHFLLIAPSKTVCFTGFPSIDRYRRIGEMLARVQAKLANDDIRIAWWNIRTLNAGPGAGYTAIRGLGGIRASMSYCPLDPGFRAAFLERFRIVAEIAKPDMIVLEDDYQFSNHGSVGFGCFCDLHLDALRQRAGATFTREDLAQRFREVNAGSMRLRRLHYEHMRETLVELAADVASTVQSVSPETRLGLCQSGNWVLDGNFTEPVTRALAGTQRPWVRLTGVSYREDLPTEMPSRLFQTLYSAQHLDETIECVYESDTFPHNRFFCSAGMLASMSTLALSYGCRELLLYATHYLPDPLPDTGYLEMYGENKERFAVLRDSLRGCTVAGIELISRPEAGTASPWTGANIRDTGLAGPKAGCRLFSRYGFPYTTLKSPVKALIGDATPRVLDDVALRHMLSGALFVDGDAARVLAERGFGELIGVELMPDRDIDSNVEVVNDHPDFDDLAGQRLYCWAYVKFGVERADIAVMRPGPRTEVITDYRYRISDADETYSSRPGLMRCVNRLGGRIVISSIALATSSSNLYSAQKRTLLHRLFTWLGAEALPAAVLQAPNVSLTANFRQDGRVLILTLINLSSDPLSALRLDVAAPFRTADVEWLDGHCWRPATVTRHQTSLEIRESFPLLKPQILRMTPNRSIHPESVEPS